MANTPDKLRRKTERAFSVESSVQDVTMKSFVSEEEAPVVLEPISPLPELNIEVMPKPNPHDEPEDFYQELEIKVKKHYGKRFYNEDCCTEEEFIELAQYEPVYDSYINEADNIEMKNKTLDYIARKESIDFENLNIASSIRQQTKHEERVIQDAKDKKSEDSSEYSADFQQITFEAEVHREASNTDEADSVVNKKNEEEVKEDEMDDQMDLEGCTRDDGKNERSTRESHDPAISILDIMRSNTDRRQSMHSIRLSGHNSASSPLHVDFRRSRSLDFELDLMQVSDLHNSTKTETMPQNNKKSIPLDEIANKMERRHLVSATSTPISGTAITQSEKTGSHGELNTARISWPSSTSNKGTKRVLEEIPEEDLSHEHKRLKLIDVGVQATDDNSDWNDLRNNLFIAVPRMYKLCCCKNHTCNR